jgi:hypothetical protein
MAEGEMDGLQFHYDKPNMFWNPKLSWENKYRNGKLTFKGKYLVFLTDGWHLLKLINHLCMFSAIGVAVLIPNTYHWYEYVSIGLGCWLIRGIGFTIVYNRF